MVNRFLHVQERSLTCETNRMKFLDPNVRSHAGAVIDVINVMDVIILIPLLGLFADILKIKKTNELVNTRILIVSNIFCITLEEGYLFSVFFHNLLMRRNNSCFFHGLRFT